MEAACMQAVTSFNLTRGELLRTLEPFVSSQLQLIPPVEKTWQPSDLLPFPAQEIQGSDEFGALIESSKGLPWELVVILVGNTVTEEALPAYSAAFRRVEGLHDRRGDEPSPWMEWSRAWTAEENRHGDLLNRFLLFSGRVNAVELERTIHRLIRNGFDTNDNGDPLCTFVYTAFQERATRLSHQRMALQADASGACLLGKICRLISADETRHEEVYTRIMTECFRLDPEASLSSYAEMMRKRIAMPGAAMRDGHGLNLFEHFSLFAEARGIYTARDYVSIIEHLNSRWNIASLTPLSSDATEQQDYLCLLPERMLKAIERRPARQTTIDSRSFAWVTT